MGVVPLEPVLRALDRSGYAGFLSVEYEGRHDVREAHRRGVGYLEEKLRLSS